VVAEVAAARLATAQALSDAADTAVAAAAEAHAKKTAQAEAAAVLAAKEISGEVVIQASQIVGDAEEVAAGLVAEAVTTTEVIEELDEAVASAVDAIDAAAKNATVVASEVVTEAATIIDDAQEVAAGLVAEAVTTTEVIEELDEAVASAVHAVDISQVVAVEVVDAIQEVVGEMVCDTEDATSELLSDVMFQVLLGMVTPSPSPRLVASARSLASARSGAATARSRQSVGEAAVSARSNGVPEEDSAPSVFRVPELPFNDIHLAADRALQRAVCGVELVAPPRTAEAEVPAEGDQALSEEALQPKSSKSEATDTATVPAEAEAEVGDKTINVAAVPSETEGETTEAVSVAQAAETERVLLDDSSSVAETTAEVVASVLEEVVATGNPQLLDAAREAASEEMDSVLLATLACLLDAQTSAVQVLQEVLGALHTPRPAAPQVDEVTRSPVTAKTSDVTVLEASDTSAEATAEDAILSPAPAEDSTGGSTEALKAAAPVAEAKAEGDSVAVSPAVAAPCDPQAVAALVVSSLQASLAKAVEEEADVLFQGIPSQGEARAAFTAAVLAEALRKMSAAAVSVVSVMQGMEDRVLVRLSEAGAEVETRVASEDATEAVGRMVEEVGINISHTYLEVLSQMEGLVTR
jgi:hypothetical protein